MSLERAVMNSNYLGMAVNSGPILLLLLPGGIVSLERWVLNSNCPGMGVSAGPILLRYRQVG